MLYAHNRAGLLSFFLMRHFSTVRSLCFCESPGWYATPEELVKLTVGPSLRFREQKEARDEVCRSCACEE